MQALLTMVLLLGLQTRGPGLCARIGPANWNAGTGRLFGHHQAPPFWGWVRDVHYQVCDPEGRSIQGMKHLELVIEPVTAVVGEPIPASREVITDEYGRFSASYGGGGQTRRAVWPEGVVTVELHHFRLNGQTIATFVLERSAAELRFYRR